MKVESVPLKKGLANETVIIEWKIGLRDAKNGHRKKEIAATKGNIKI